MPHHLDERVRASIACLDRTLPSIEANLALDEALLIATEERGAGPVLRVWESPALAVVLGASSRLHEDVEVDLCRAEGVAVARRSSGGGTVLIGPGALNVTVVLPADAAPGLTAVDTSQAFVLERMAGALRQAGPLVRVQGSGDLTLADRKFAGSAQRRLRHHFFVHVSVLYEFPIAPIARYMRLPRRQPAYRAGRSHEDFLTNLPLSRSVLLDCVRAAWFPSDPAPAREVLDDLVDELVRTRYGDPGWVSRL